MAEVERIVTGVPAWLLREYVRDAGGRDAPGGSVEGAGWRATFADAPDHVVGALRVGRVRLTVSGDAAAVAAVWRAVEPRLLRGGG